MANVIRFAFVFLAIFSTALFGEQTDEAVKVDPAKDETNVLFPASQLPVDEPADKFTGELLNMLMTLGFLVAGILALSWILKRMLNAKVQQQNVSSNIKVLERRSLSPKAGIYLIEVLGKTLVIGESPAGFQHLATIDDAEEEKGPTPFERVLDRQKE